ncbi:hypothetical protein [Nostocoides sp. Soil756]|jgi:hypothetical protein|uniref:hypothetical protein n=1 Tax=Nostocoides sp. Soil756 TaxID=1736399 RepID=UPI0006F68737|nr:hypothetical protein [Tetrasphaera sp. Soil756]KRE62088.1 hypothetical protein ASG78_03225 [Tetrasphaera sp. Soil756]
MGDEASPDRSGGTTTVGEPQDRAAQVGRRLGRGAATSLAAAVAFSVLGVTTGRLVVVGDVVMRPGPTGVVLLGLAAALGAARVALARRAGGGPVPWPRPRTRLVLLTVAAIGATGLALLGDVPASYRVLAPPGPDGCRVVVEERSFLLAGGGTVHVLPPYAVLTRPVGRYDADDGYRPFAAGSWSLTWRDETATLHLSGGGADPVWPRDQQVSCSG